MSKKKFSWLVVIFILVFIQACNFPGQSVQVPGGETSAPVSTNSPGGETPLVPSSPTETDTRMPVVHTLMPGEPPAALVSEITDRDSSLTAGERRANGGENYALNLYERPFSANTMDTYFPDLDITRASLRHDSTWVYVTIRLVGPSPSGGMSGNYGVEVDLDVDGRGDLLLFAATPGTDWSTDGVRIWSDANNDVGSVHPVQTDAPVAGDGYETIVFDSGIGSDPDAAWARLAPSDPNSIQIAFKASLLNGDDKYTWNAWTDRSVLTPAWFDYNDHFTFAEAGSPLTEQAEYYPAKALYEMDNTCRWVVGFTPTGLEPGICPVPVTPTVPGPGGISGTVYDNGINGGLSYTAGSMPRAGISVTVRSGSCGSPGGVLATATTNGSGNYSFSVSAGTYCVSASTPSSHQTGPQTVTVAAGGSVGGVNFFYYTYLGMR
jgi:hypothetical protein